MNEGSDGSNRELRVNDDTTSHEIRYAHHEVKIPKNLIMGNVSIAPGCTKKQKLGNPHVIK